MPLSHHPMQMIGSIEERFPFRKKGVKKSGKPVPPAAYVSLFSFVFNKNRFTFV
jgi:hypothetical protein